MSGVRLSRPTLALPFTVVADGETVHLIAGEDLRYSIRAGEMTARFAELLRHCDGIQTFDILLNKFAETERDAASKLIERLSGERILVDGPVEMFHRAELYHAVPEGCGPLYDRQVVSTIKSPMSAASATQADLLSSNERQPIFVLYQNSLDYHTAREFNRRHLGAGDSPWMWVTTGPASRGYVSPVFLPDAGPCLTCLLRHFQRLSPVPKLYDALVDHGEKGNEFPPMPFSDEALAILEQIAAWKIRQMSVTPPPSAIFQLHVLELDNMEVSVHRVFVDPTCPDCHNARLV